MRAYGSRSLSTPRRRGGAWRRLVWIFLFGFIAGALTSTILQTRKPVELVISTPPAPEIVSEDISEEIWSEGNNLSVRVPRPNALIDSPLRVEGLERTFEQNVVLRLKDAKGNELAKIATTGTAPDVGIHGPYQAELTFEKPATKTGELEVFQNSPKDGEELDKIAVPVRFE